MRTPRVKFIMISPIALGVALVVWALIDARPPVSLTVISLTTNQWSKGIAARFGSRTYVRAVVAVTNNTSRPFTYWTGYSEESVAYRILHETPLGWKEPASGWRCGFGLQQHTLPPSSGFTFQAVVETDKPCKVALDYSDVLVAKDAHREQTVRAFFEQHGIEAFALSDFGGGDAARGLVYPLPSGAPRAISLTIELLRSVYGLSEEAGLDFRYYEVEAAA